MLTKVALKTTCQRYHVVKKSAVLALLDRSVQTPDLCDALSTCKLVAIFALGDAYSARVIFPGAVFPGIDYYNIASNMLRVLSEEPRIECVEIMAMLVSSSSSFQCSKYSQHQVSLFCCHAVRYTDESPSQRPIESTSRLRAHRASSETVVINLHIGQIVGNYARATGVH